jgi:hypothetical protein
LLLFREKELWHNKILSATTHQQSHRSYLQEKEVEKVEALDNYDVSDHALAPDSSSTDFSFLHPQNQHPNAMTPSSKADRTSGEEVGENESGKDNAETDDDPVSSARPWYFTNGERYPKPARISKKTKRRLAKLIPSEDVRGDRITNQLMYVPPNYEEIKNEGRVKTILLYNGLGPWNVKQGKKNLRVVLMTLMHHVTQF